ncbi:MAG: hypothetical protein MUO94_09175 [Thermoplasmata archaeon]|nr:hypothetical protein [Thermoplasmata archaeon]
MEMKCRRTLAASVVMLSMILSSTAIATASHDVDIPITDAPEGVAVFFADNMVYAPQWRVGNLVRIETMILDVSSCIDENDVLDMDLMPLEVSQSVSEKIDPETGEILVYDQGDLIGTPGLLDDTYMVSVPGIEIVITSLVDDTVSYPFSGGLDKGAWVGDVTREINQHGHLIYGFLWATEGLLLGAYEVSVKLPVEYDIRASVANVYPVVDETTQGDPTNEPPEVEVDPIGFDILPVPEGDTTTGCGDVRDETNEAYVILGPLVDGGSAGTSGDNGDDNGGGNDETGNAGNTYGGPDGHRRI